MLKAAVPSAVAHRKRRARVGDELLPGGAEARLRFAARAAIARRIARLLLPGGHEIEYPGRQGRALYHLHQPGRREIGEQQAENETAAEHAGQQHHVHQRDHARARGFAGQISGQRQTGGLRGLHAGAHQQEGEPGGDRTDPQRPGGIAGQDHQRERHDRQSGELQHAAEPQVGHPAPAKRRAMVVGAEADQRAERRHQQRQRDHGGDHCGGHAELDDHDAVQRAHQQRCRHAHRDLEQRQPQQPRERQVGAGGIGERQVARPECDQCARAGRDEGRQRRRQRGQRARGHARASSMA
jgi:hypothetical protein